MKKLNLNRIAISSVLGLALAAGVTVTGAGTAFAAGPATPHAAASTHAAPPRGALDGTLGFKIWNNSSYTFVPTGSDGMSIGPAGNYLPGMQEDWEIKAGGFWNGNTGAEYFNMYDENDQQVGSMELDFNGEDVTPTHIRTAPMGGTTDEAPDSTILRVVNGADGGFQIEDMTSDSQTINVSDGNGAWVSALGQSICTGAGTSACEFGNITEKDDQKGPQEVLVAAYNPATRGSDELTTEKAFEYSTTDETDTTLSASADVMDAVNIGVSTTFQHAVTQSTNYGTEFEVPVTPGNSDAIFGYAPVDQYTGNFTIQLGNTTWHLNDASFDTPDATGTMRYSSSGELPGDRTNDVDFQQSVGVNNNLPSVN